MKQKYSVEVKDLDMTISTGTIAKQANGSVTISVGETTLFVSAVAANYAATFMFQRTAAFRAVFNCFRGCFLYRFFCGCGCNCRSRKDLTAVFL